jgi:anti-sigma factor ChrR (cupin superfamily)
MEEEGAWLLRQVQRACQRFRDGALNEAEKIELDRHLEECASCRALQAVYEAIHADIEASAVEPPEGFSAGVMMRIRAMNQNASQNAPSAPPSTPPIPDTPHRRISCRFV